MARSACSIRRIDHDPVIVNLFLGNELEGGPANLWLRRLGDRVDAVPLPLAPLAAPPLSRELP